MKLARLIEYLRNRLPTVVGICFIALAFLILVDAFLVSKEDTHTRAEHFPAFWSIFGFLGCVVIVIFSKLFGHAGIMTRENYYDPQAVEGNRTTNGHE